MKPRTAAEILLVALAIAVLLAPLASQWPDGLEKVAERLGFADRAEVAPAVAAPVPDYQVPGVARASVSTALAGVLGTILVFVLLYGVARVATSMGARRHAPDSP